MFIHCLCPFYFPFTGQLLTHLSIPDEMYFCAKAKAKVHHIGILNDGQNCYTHVKLYSRTSDKGHNRQNLSIKDTLGCPFSIILVHFNIRREDNLSVKDKMAGSTCPLFSGSTVYPYNNIASRYWFHPLPPVACRAQFQRGR